MVRGREWLEGRYGWKERIEEGDGWREGVVGEGGMIRGGGCLEGGNGWRGEWLEAGDGWRERMVGEWEWFEAGLLCRSERLEGADD
jgi:hypothetical protein